MLSIINYAAMRLACLRLGIWKLRPQQEEAMKAICQGLDALIVMMTSGGKSALFQIPAIARFPRVSLVISPLKALQEDQVHALLAKNIPAFVLNSDMAEAKRKQVLKEVVDRGGILYLAPEQLQNKEVRKALLSADVALVAVDEAHVLAQSKDDFRTAYGEIGTFINTLPDRPQVLALTATATPFDCHTIIESLKMRDPEVFKFPIRRDNLHLYVKALETKSKAHKRNTLEINRFNAVERELDAWNGDGAAIIYCNTVTMVKSLYEWLKARDYPVCKYHGKMDLNERNKSQKQFMSGSRPIAVATNAFGLGIDKPDVRLIIHAGLPLSLDGYVQEIGRAGRDGKKSRCVLFYAKSDFSVNERILKHSSSAETKCLKLRRLQALRELIKSHKCLWREIEKYFGQKPKGNCGKCCNCQCKPRNAFPL